MVSMPRGARAVIKTINILHANGKTSIEPVQGTMGFIYPR